MNLDVNHMVCLDMIVSNEDMKPRERDATALEYINKMKLPANAPGLRTQYVKYYFEAKRDYKTLQELGQLDIFRQDI